MSDTQVPAKIQSWIDRAAKLGLTVESGQIEGTDIRTWTVASPNPIDGYELWLYFTPGRNGGRLGITHYHGVTGGRHNRTRPTQKMARIIMGEMGESLQRHLQRQARAIAEEAAVLAVTTSADDLRAALQEMAKLKATGPYPAQRVKVYTEALRLIACREALATVGAELDGAEIPALAGCGCPLDLIADAGHQEGCTTGAEESDRAERLGITVQQLRAETDPTRPGWFEVGQGITDRANGTHHRVALIEHDNAGKVARVAVSTNGGYGRKLHWYGEHPEAVAGLDALEGPHVGMDDTERRPWPRGLASAQSAIGNVLTDQCLSGWAVGRLDPDRIVVNVPNGTDPTRHFILLERYIPYRDVSIRLRNPGKGNRLLYPTIVIEPRGE